MSRTLIAFKPRQSGLSLIELMIAMLVGLILIAGVLSVFMSSRKTYGVNGAVGQIQENGRFALNLIGHDVRMAGYLGCGGSAASIGNQLTAPANTTLPYNFTSGMAGFEYTGTEVNSTYPIASESPPHGVVGDWMPSLDPSLPVNGTDYVVPGSDVLVVRLSPATPTAAYVDPATPPSGADFTLTANPGITKGSLMVVSNCSVSYVVQANLVGGAGNDTVTVNGTGGVFPSNQVTGIPSSFTGAQVSTVNTEVFYVGMDATGAPGLFEAITNPNCAAPATCFGAYQLQELVPNVENMQVLYGVDPVGAQVPNQYVTADNVADWNQVVSVKIALLVRSNLNAVIQPATAPSYNLLGTTVTAPLDTRLRQVFTATIGVRNNR